MRLTDDDDMLWNNSEEEGDVSECEGDEGTHCEDGERERERERLFSKGR
jgi:hypothetical protein